MKAATAPAPRPHNRRQELLDAAARPFNARGFEAAPVHDVAAAAIFVPSLESQGTT